MRSDTEIDGLYMTGQDAWTPAIAGAMYGGLLGAIKVIKFERFYFKCTKVFYLFLLNQNMR